MNYVRALSDIKEQLSQQVTSPPLVPDVERTNGGLPQPTRSPVRARKFDGGGCPLDTGSGAAHSVSQTARSAAPDLLPVDACRNLTGELPPADGPLTGHHRGPFQGAEERQARLDEARRAQGMWIKCVLAALLVLLITLFVGHVASKAIAQAAYDTVNYGDYNG